MKPKVFIIIPSLHKGGAERVVSILVNNLSRKGYEVSLVMLNYSEHGYFIAANVKIVYLNKGRRNNIISRIYTVTTTFIKLISLIKRDSPKYLISFTTTANLWAGIACNIFGIPYIVSERTSPERTIHKYPPLLKKIVFQLYKRSKAIVVPSEGIMLNLKKNKEFNGLHNYVIIHNPVTQFYNFSKEKVHFRKFILSAGRLHSVKGFDRLIDAYSRIKTEDIDLIILGEGPEREKLVKQISDLGLTKRVFLPGAKDNVHDYYTQCEVFVLTSRNEGYPNALIEAMSAGCASIALDCDFGPREIIEHGENGLLIPNNDIELLIQAIDTVLADPLLKDKLSDKAKEVGITNSTAAIVSKWEELILAYD
jgi:glycosyltransferase involved in cell wall biosynthesis